MTSTSVELRNVSVRVTVEAGVQITLHFQRGASLATDRTIACAAVFLNKARQQEFVEEREHKVPHSNVRFIWRVCKNGFIEIDFLQEGKGKRFLYKRGARARVKRL